MVTRNRDGEDVDRVIPAATRDADSSPMKRIGIVAATVSVAAGLAGAAIASGGHHAAAQVGGFGGALAPGAHPVQVWQEPAGTARAVMHRVACTGDDSGASCYSR
jgi:hypothetical protein